MGESKVESVLPGGRQRDEIHRELERVLAAAEFRQSEQSKRLLRYLVEGSLDGEPERLRERSIGVELFGLAAGYDTTENPIVRVRANEIRKRLAKYYLNAPPGEWRLEIPSGAYRVQFRAMELPAAAEPAAPPPPPGWGRRRWLAAAGGAAAVAAAGGGAWWRWTGRDLEERFWAPALDSGRPVLLCGGHPVVYRLANEAIRRIQGEALDHYRSQTVELRPGPETVLKGSDVVAMPDQYVGLGSAEAIARIHGWLQRRKKDSEIRFGNDLGFSDLRNRPALILGAYSNRWMMELMKGLRYVFALENGAPRIRDTQSGKSWGLPRLEENGHTPEDYVLITRLLTGPSGEFMIAAAGITQYGGRTVAEVLTNAAVLERMLEGASERWGDRNLQILMRVEVIGKTAGPPARVGYHEW